LYAAGFLYGLSTGLPLEKCGQIGSLLAGKVIEVLGAKMHKGIWQNIVEKVKEIEKA
jgi:sugar/nucleoside kinase (ribokinase family)